MTNEREMEREEFKKDLNAAGGVAIIVGALTGKLLYVWVCNNQCATRSKADRLHTPVQKQASQD